MRISMLGAIPFAIGFTIIVCAVEGKPKRNEPKTVKTSYTKPIVADSVLNDWANDPKISPEKRVVLNEMVKEK